MKRILIYFIIFLFAAGCGSSQVVETVNATEATSREVTVLETDAVPTSAVEAKFDPAFYAEGAGSNFVPLDDPDFVSATEVTYLDADEYVLGIVMNGEARAYPVRMAAYHHIINDSVGGDPLLVTY